MRLAGLLVALLLLSSCTVSNVRRDIDAKSQESARILEKPAVQIAERPRVTVNTEASISVKEVPIRENSWLDEITVKIGEIRGGVPLSEVVRKFNSQGINIVSDLDLSAYTFSGSVNSTSASSALKLVLGSVGLDYTVNAEGRYVTVKPLSSKTWYLNLGNRKTSFASSGTSVGQQGNATGGQAGGASGAQPGGQGGGGGAQQGGESGGGAQSNGVSSGVGSGLVSIYSNDDFWKSLHDELTARLSILVPSPIRSREDAAASNPFDAGAVGSVSQGAASSTESYIKRKVGEFSLNPETGAITVQAPHWVIVDLDTYMSRVQAMYNTDISFTGELILVSSTKSDSEGLDISAFGEWASNRYGAVLANNGLGGVTVSFPAGNGNIPTVSAARPPLGGALVGAYSKADGLAVFNAYLSELGKVAVLQRPVVTTTSGIPGEFSKLNVKYYNSTSQQAASGNSGSAVQATTNTIVAKEFGTVIRINPRYDIKTGLIRAQMSINNIIPAGQQNIVQTISVGDGYQSIPVQIPLDTKLSYAGEALLKDGDLVIVGGQTESNLQSDENGIPGFDAPVSGIFGVKKGQKITGTYYFAMRVAVTRRM